MDRASILICYDRSEPADGRFALPQPSSLRAPLPCSTWRPCSRLGSATRPLGAGPAVFEDLNRAGAVEQAQAGAELARAAGLHAEARGDIGAPTWDAVVAVADEIDAAAIVIGSRGLDGLREAFEGSLSHQVADHAGRPVLIVPPAQK